MQPVNINVITAKVTKDPETPKKCFAVCEKHANAEKIIKQKKISCITKIRKCLLPPFALIRPVY